MGCINSKLVFIFLACLISAAVADVAFHLASLSAPRSGLSAIEAGSKVYFIGGYEHGDLRATKTIEVYDLIAQNMSSPLQLYTPRAFITPIVIEPNIYFIGGFGYSVPTMLFDPLQRQFVNMGEGPTVVSIQAMSLFGSFLVNIGLNGVDILDAQLGQWKDLTPLANLFLEMALCGIVSEQGVVIALGGVNVTSEVYSTSAWVYNVTSGELREYPDIVPAGLVKANVATSPVYGSNGVVAIDLGYAVLLHHSERQAWRTVSFPSLTRMASLPDMTVLSNSSTLATLDWSNTDSQLVYEVSNDDLRHVFVINNTAVSIREGPGITTFEVYSPEVKAWISTLSSMATFASVLQSVSLKSGWHIFATNTPSVFGYNPTLNKLYQVQNISFAFGLSALISAEEIDQVYIIEIGKVTKILFSESGISNLLVQQSCAITPVTRIGSDFLNGQGRIVSVDNLTQAITPNITFPLYSTKYNDEHFAIAPSIAFNYARVYYDHVDIYNYVTKEWNSTAMPEELKSYGLEVQWFYSATALEGKLVVWKSSVISVYDSMTGNWTSYTNYNQSQINNVKTNVHMPVPTAQDKAFMRTDNNTLDVFSADLLPSWNSTAPAPMIVDSIQYKFQQCLVYNGSQLFINSVAVTRRDTNYGTLLIYDVVENTWRSEQLPNALTAPPTMALAGDYLLSMNNNILSYYDLINRIWDDHELDFTFSPAIVLESSTNVTFMAGGFNKFGTYSNRMMIIPHDAITTKPPSGPTVKAPPSKAGLSEGELIAAIVVPIAAVLITTALLVFFLVRRQKQRRRRGGSTSATGLESKYGQWFIPFSSIKFGDQLGQGASGQVFKGTWNSTSVALKVSMTQANMTVISELELMIQLRPHPNVIQLLGFSVHPETDSIILVIEFCNGGSLDDALFDEQQISMQQKISWLLSMAKGIEHLHANNIVHRDIAARNVLLHQNEPKITDFGMSRLIDEDKQRGTTKSELGPIRWMSPESLKNKEYSNKSDVWSFGALMFEVIAQSEPHVNADPIEIGRLIRDNGLTPTIPSSCPSDLAELIRECWHMSPDKRISIDQIVHRLETMQR